MHPVVLLPGSYFLKKISGAEGLTPEKISFKSKYEGVKNGRSKRIK